MVKELGAKFFLGSKLLEVWFYIFSKLAALHRFLVNCFLGFKYVFSVKVWYICLSEGFWAGPAQGKVVKIKFLVFSFWASSTPWGYVLSLKTFCRNPALSWAIRYSVFQKVKFTGSLEFLCGNPFSIFWHLMVKFG